MHAVVTGQVKGVAKYLGLCAVDDLLQLHQTHFLLLFVHLQVLTSATDT